MIQWSWRVEKLRSIEFGSWSTDRTITNRVQTLVGRSISKISLTGHLPELQIELSGSRWVSSFHTSDGQPQWTIFMGDRWLHARNGQIEIEHKDDGPS